MTTRALLCQDLEGEGLPLASLASFLKGQGVEAQVVPSLCRHPHQIPRLAQGASRLIVVTCRRWEAEGELEGYARRGGVNPLALQVVPLARLWQMDPAPMEKALAALAGAVARAQAFPGARPENLRPSLLPGGHRLSRRALISLPSLTYRPVPTVRRARCAADRGCRHCVRVCPHQALEDEGGAIGLRREACTSCGVCVASCPHQALEMPGWSLRELEKELEALFSYGRGRGIAFVCPQVAPPTGPWLAARVTCAAAVPVAALLRALGGGAGRVAVVHCGPRCRSGLRQEVEARIDFCRALLAALGLAPERLLLVEAANGEAHLPPLPLGEATAREAAPIAGVGADADAVASLAVGRPVNLEHPGAPLGLVDVDESSCTLGGTCASSCPTGALAYETRDGWAHLSFQSDLCIACGQCLEACPERERGAIRLRRGVDTERLRRGRQDLASGELALCQRCGEVVAPRKMLARLESLLGPQARSRPALGESAGRVRRRSRFRLATQ